MLQRADMMKSCMIARPDSLTYPLCALLSIRPFARPELALESFPKPETEFTLALFNDSEQYEFREPFKYLTVTHRLVRNERRATKKVATVYALSMEDLYKTSDTQSQGGVYSVRCCNTKAIGSLKLCFQRDDTGAMRAVWRFCARHRDGRSCAIKKERKQVCKAKYNSIFL